MLVVGAEVSVIALLDPFAVISSRSSSWSRSPAVGSELFRGAGAVPFRSALPEEENRFTRSAKRAASLEKRKGARDRAPLPTIPRRSSAAS